MLCRQMFEVPDGKRIVIIFRTLRYRTNFLKGVRLTPLYPTSSDVQYKIRKSHQVDQFTNVQHAKNQGSI